MLLTRTDFTSTKNIIHRHSLLNNQTILTDLSKLKRWSDIILSRNGLTTNKVVALINEEKINLNYLQAIIKYTTLNISTSEAIKNKVIEILLNENIIRDKLFALFDLNKSWSSEDAAKILIMLWDSGIEDAEKEIIEIMLGISSHRREAINKRIKRLKPCANIPWLN